MSDTKALRSVEIKDANEGTVEAVFSTFNVKDHDNDVTLPGAFEDGAKVRISAYGHSSWGPSRGASSVPQPPVGKGVIRVSGDEALLEGQFFLKTQAGRDHFELVKEMDDLQEWSYGYDIVDSEAGQFEGEKVRFLKQMVVHEVSPVLLGAGVGTRTVSVKNLPLSEQADGVLGDVTTLIDRVKAFGSQSADPERMKEGRVLSAANRERLAQLVTALGEAGVSLEQFLADSDPNKHRDAFVRELVRFEQLRAQSI